MMLDEQLAVNSAGLVEQGLAQPRHTHSWRWNAGDRLTQLLKAAEAAFDQKFASKFGDLETASNPKGKHCQRLSMTCFCQRPY